MSRSTINIIAKNFNFDKLVISDSMEIKTKAGFKMKVAEISYLNDNNKPCDLYISLPKVETYGPYPQYPFNSTSKNSKDICGYTISYQHKEIKKLFQAIQKVVSKKFKKCNIKPVFTKNKNDIETAYFKLKMNGVNISTKFYSDNKCSKTINGLDIVTTYGELTPMIHVRSLYFGAHGSTDYNCSLQINLAQAIFKETQSNIPAMSIDSEEEQEQEEEEEEEDN